MTFCVSHHAYIMDRYFFPAANRKAGTRPGRENTEKHPLFDNTKREKTAEEMRRLVNAPPDAFAPRRENDPAVPRIHRLSGFPRSRQVRQNMA